MPRARSIDKLKRDKLAGRDWKSKKRRLIKTKRGRE